MEEKSHKLRLYRLNVATVDIKQEKLLLSCIFIAHLGMFRHIFMLLTHLLH